jgi:hypothetical protein
MAASTALILARRRLSQLMMRPAVTLLELLCAVVVTGLLLGGGHAVWDRYMRAQRANQVADLIRWEVTVARSFAMRTGRPMTLGFDERTRTVTLRDGSAVRRTVTLGDAARFRVDRIDIAIPGDSLVFSPRGLCVNCRPGTTTDLSIEAEGKSATVQVEVMGRPTLVGRERAGGA